ncbi:hypothetical protein IGI04_042705 [Brassica rapa subsp. trilocularis]|uniref:Uncharacterized protein n=1 Tax=Brassica rapa subsp. trilocularis TaxID=1813537 RepID=A0ABQ7KKD4_BRACM|nr:hypothetical protein IGI04_042705 [Brassica rapa subsp. trilocularis]
MTRIEFTTACQDALGVLSSDFGQPRHYFRTNTISGLAKAGCLVAFSLKLFGPGFGDIRKLCRKKSARISCTEAGRCLQEARSARRSSVKLSLARSNSSQLDGLFVFWADGPGPGQWRAMRFGHVVHESLSYCRQAVGLVTRSWLGLDVRSGPLIVIDGQHLSQKDASKGCDSSHMTFADRLDQKGTSRQRLRVAKCHELPKVVRYQRMQVTKRYEIPMVASIKGYEDQRVPMTVHRDPRLRVAKDHVVIQETHIMAMEGRLYQYMLSGRWLIKSSGRIMFHDDGVGPNLINECIGWYEQIIYVVWVKSQGRSGQMKTHQFQDLMSFVSPEDGLGTIAYKAKGFRIVHEPRKAICKPLSFQRLLKGYLCLWGWLLSSKKNLSQWRTDELISSIDVAKLDYYLTQLRQLGVSSSQLDGLFEFWADGPGPGQWRAMRSGHVVHEWLGSSGQAVGLGTRSWLGLDVRSGPLIVIDGQDLSQKDASKGCDSSHMTFADRLDQKGTSRQRLRVAKGHELPRL